MSRMSMNGFTISDSEQLPIGHGVYLGASAINHSCRPNCLQTFWIRPHAPPMLYARLELFVRAMSRLP